MKRCDKGLVSTGVWLYPQWLDPTPEERGAELREMGVSYAAVAVSYHSARVLMPDAHGSRVVHLSPGLNFVPSDGFLRKVSFANVVSPTRPRTPLEVVFAGLRRSGVAPEAWVVLGHNSAIGGGHPEVSVENLYGDRYPYGLCPCNAAVREFMVCLLEEVCERFDVDRVILEHWHYPVLRHGAHHEVFQTPPESDWLLSLCFCSSCHKEAARMGIDLERARRVARQVLDRLWTLSSSRRIERCLSDAMVRLRELQAMREQVVASVVRDLAGSSRKPLALFLPLPDDWRACAVEPRLLLGSRVDLILPVYAITWGKAGELISQLAADSPPGSELAVSVWGGYPGVRGRVDVMRAYEWARSCGVPRLYVYNYSLMTEAQRGWLRSAILA